MIVPHPEDRTDSLDTRTSARWGLTALLALLTAIGYANAVHGSFVYDDKYLVADGFLIDARSLLRLFREHAWAATGTPSDVYRPLLLTLLAIEGGLHGGSALGFHLTNVLLHLLTTLVLYGLLRALLRGTRDATLSAFVAALLFGLHPIHTEVVDSIFNRSELLATLGVLGATWVVWCWVATRPLRTWAGVALIYFAALLCRESAATLPGLVLIVVVGLRPELAFTARGRRNLWPVVMLLGVVGVYFLLRRSALAVVSASSGASDTAFVVLAGNPAWRSRLGTALCMLREGLRLVIWPHPLRANYNGVGVGGPANALAILALVSGSAALLRRTLPGLFLGLGFFLVALLPSTRILTLASISGELAERYLYLPSVGVALAVAFLVARGIARFGRRPVIAAACLVAALFGALTVQRNAQWRSDRALWEAEARVAPDSAESWCNLIAADLDGDRVAEAAQLCDAHLAQLAPSAKLQTNCAVAYERKGRQREAGDCYRRAVDLGSGLGATTHINLGRFYRIVGRQQDAEREYLLGIAMDSDPARQHYRRGQFLLEFHPELTAQAAREFARARELQPRFTPARKALRGSL